MKLRTLGGLTMLFFFAWLLVPSGQSTVEGTWVSTDFGANPFILVFKVEGSTVTGAVGVGNPTRPVENGRINGDTIVFTASNATGGRVVTFTGKLSGDQIAFTRSVAVIDPVQNNGSGPLGALGPMAFVARRRDSQAVAAVEIPPRSTGLISINDNRTAAGALAGGTLTIRLEARAGEWHPDRDSGPGVVVNAFAVDGGPLQVPGPLIRVREGTEVRASIHNSLEGKPLEIHGLYSRVGAPSSASDLISIPAGETRDVRFTAGKPGTYYYWGETTAGVALPNRSGTDSQLSGAFIVEPRTASPLPDRVLLISGWRSQDQTRGRIAINGRSWPNTERLTYDVGDTVRMRVINAGAAVHPMHLHGFYFNVDSRGDERQDLSFGPGASHLVVTERLDSGRTFSLTWKPTRPGNWLFHCHDNIHLAYGGNLDGSERQRPADHHVENHALEAMAGPVMGITVRGAGTAATEPPSVGRRQFRLTARVDTGGTESDPAFGYSLESPGDATPKAPSLPGPLLLLKRGEPVSITVVNQLPEPTSVHWHGIEVDSYYDGVAGFSGRDGQISPAIAPGESFEALLTPPRSGTFIYHTHIDEVRQQQAGLSGPLIVVDDPATYDPEHNVIVMVTVPRKDADGNVVLVNGSSKPEMRVLNAGQRYRFRFINIHISRPSMHMRLLRDSTLTTWRAVAKDGMDLPPDQRIDGPSDIQMGNGETYDFDFVPTAPGDMRLDVTAGNGNLLSTMPIRVR